MKRSLILVREALTELNAGDLVDVAGAAPYSGPGGISCPLRACTNFTMPPTCYSIPWC